MKRNHTIIYKIDQMYGAWLRKYIQSLIYTYKNLPVQSDDIYNLFLANLGKTMDTYDDEKGSIKTFLMKQCYFFTKNTIRTYSSKPYEILNNCASYDESINFEENEIFAEEVSPPEDDIEKPIDSNELIRTIFKMDQNDTLVSPVTGATEQEQRQFYKSLTIIEKMYFELIYIEKRRRCDVEKLLKITYFRSRSLNHSIKEKMSKIW